MSDIEAFGRRIEKWVRCQECGRWCCGQKGLAQHQRMKHEGKARTMGLLSQHKARVKKGVIEDSADADRPDRD